MQSSVQSQPTPQPQPRHLSKLELRPSPRSTAGPGSAGGSAATPCHGHSGRPAAEDQGAARRRVAERERMERQAAIARATRLLAGEETRRAAQAAEAAKRTAAAAAAAADNDDDDDEIEEVEPARPAATRTKRSIAVESDDEESPVAAAPLGSSLAAPTPATAPIAPTVGTGSHGDVR